MTRRLTVICHVWPGITPMNVWDLTLEQWGIFRDSADEWVKAHKQK